MQCLQSPQWCTVTPKAFTCTHHHSRTQGTSSAPSSLCGKCHFLSFIVYLLHLLYCVFTVPFPCSNMLGHTDTYHCAVTAYSVEHSNMLYELTAKSSRFSHAPPGSVGVSALCDVHTGTKSSSDSFHRTQRCHEGIHSCGVG